MSNLEHKSLSRATGDWKNCLECPSALETVLHSILFVQFSSVVNSGRFWRNNFTKLARVRATRHTLCLKLRKGTLRNLVFQTLLFLSFCIYSKTNHKHSLMCQEHKTIVPHVQCTRGRSVKVLLCPQMWDHSHRRNMMKRPDQTVLFASCGFNDASCAKNYEEPFFMRRFNHYCSKMVCNLTFHWTTLMGVWGSIFLCVPFSPCTTIAQWSFQFY